MPHTNGRWYPYEKDCSYYKLDDGILRQCPMNADGSRDNSPGEVDWSSHGVEDEDRPRLREIMSELERLP